MCNDEENTGLHIHSWYLLSMTQNAAMMMVTGRVSRSSVARLAPPPHFADHKSSPLALHAIFDIPKIQWYQKSEKICLSGVCGFQHDQESQGLLSQLLLNPEP